LIGLGIIIADLLLAVFAQYIAPYPGEGRGDVVDIQNRMQPPSMTHLFGTDEVGRDILSRIIFGSRISLMLGIGIISIGASIGVILGLIAGVSGGLIDTAIMRITDIFLAIPYVALALAITAALGPSFQNLILAVGFAWFPGYVRLVQGEVIHIKEEQFVEASKSLGASKLRIAFRDILPNVINPLVVKVSLDLGFAILTGSALGFLGMGAQPPTPEWGTMISTGRINLPTTWWTVTFPGIALFLTVLGFNLLGDGLRDFFAGQE
jgi:peptide/nickel transport system permease protein